MGLPTYINYWGIAETTFKYSDYLQALANETSESFSQKSTLNYYIKEVNSWTRTPNDDAWTNNNILIYEKALENLNTDIESIKANWQQAVEAFQGKLEMDATQMPGYEEVATAVEAYNAAATAFIESQEAFTKYAEENLTSSEVFNKAIEDANGVLERALDVNEEEYDASIKAADEKVEQAKIARDIANAAYNKAVAEYDLIDNPTEEQTGALRTALATAQTASENLTKAENERDGAIDKAENTRAKKDAVAYADFQVAIAAAKEAEKKNEANDEAITNKLDELYNAIYDSEEGTQAKMIAAYNEAADIYRSYCSELQIPIRLDVLTDALNNYEEGQWLPKQAEAEELAKVYRYEVEYYIRQLSGQLFGKTDRLVELSVDEMKAEIEQEYMERYPDADFVPFASVIGLLSYNYGMVGQAAYYQALIDLAKATLENEEAIEDLKAELNDHLAAVNDIIAKAAEEAASAEWAYTQADEALQAKFADIDPRP